QIFQELLDPTSLLSTNDGGANVLLIRCEDWLRNLPRSAETSAAEIQEHLEQTAEQLAQALKAAAARGTPFLVSFCPGSAVLRAGKFSQMVSRLEDQLVAT